jgi:hypothetical protein
MRLKEIKRRTCKRRGRLATAGRREREKEEQEEVSSVSSA